MSSELRNDWMARGKEQGEHLIQGKECDQPEKLELSAPKKERDEEWRTRREFTRWNDRGKTEEAPYERKLMLERETNSGKKKGGRAEKQMQLGRGNRRISWREKTPVEIIEERKQRLRTSRMDTRLRTPVPRRKGCVGGKNKDNFGQRNNNDVGGRTKDWTPKRQRGSSRLDERCTRWKEMRTNDRKTNYVILKKNLKGKRSNSKHLRQDSSLERRRGWGVKRIPTLRYN